MDPPSTTSEHGKADMAGLMVTAATFVAEGRHLLRQVRCYSDATENRRFRALFGVTPDICAHIWVLLRSTAPPRASPKHLLWALMFMKVYASEHVNRVLSGADEKTFRKWVWIFIGLISNIQLIKWEEREIDRTDYVYKASVDGVDFLIQEPSPFDPMWYSHKFNGPGLRYEVGVTIATGNICWAHGPFPCGRYSNLKIYKLSLKHRLRDGEKVIADGGYKDSTCSYGTEEYINGACGYIRARHEAVNKRMKQFAVLGRRFRHPLRRHSDCFYAIANITYLLIKNSEPIFY